MLTAGALALAVITPALDPVEHSAEAVTTTPRTLPATPEFADLSLTTAIQKRQLTAAAAERREITFDPVTLAAGLESRLASSRRASRAMPRRATVLRPVMPRVNPVPLALRRPVAVTRPAAVTRAVARPVERRIALRPAGRVALRPVGRVAQRPVGRVAQRPAAARVAQRQVAVQPRAVRVTRARVARPMRKNVLVQRKRVSYANRSVAPRVTRSSSVRRLRASGGSRDMRAVVAYARSQLGKRYVRGGEGASGFDCSGLTKRAYARAGISLPHSSGSQARRARSVSRSQARPGDLVVGPGHVGIYMGGGMMIDAGNHRTGVVYRKLYRGLSVERLH